MMQGLINVTILTLVIVLIAIGCKESTNSNPILFPEYETNVKLRRKLFFRCLKSVPKGPTHVKYNDWDEVVKVCERTSLYLANECVKNCPKFNK